MINGTIQLLNIDRRILAHFDYVTVALLIPIVFLSGWLIYEIHPVLGQKHLTYVTIGTRCFYYPFFIADSTVVLDDPYFLLEQYSFAHRR